MEEIKLTVYCFVYNHEKYLRSALEGFVSQKTDFRYEVIVHDDASTDGSAKIIREYAEKYPDIIKPVYQTENQCSQGVPMFLKFIYPRLRGKYVAACEGDDYWCDEHKLQKQADFLDAHPEYSACAHNTMILRMKDNTKVPMFPDTEDKDITFEDTVKGKSYHTSSLMYRYEYAGLRPEFFDKAKTFEDTPKAILLSLNGKIRFFHEIMSVYRHGTSGSWSSRSETSLRARVESYTNYAEMLKSVNTYTNYRYKEFLERYIAIYEMNAASFRDKAGDFWTKENRTAFGYLSPRGRGVILFRVYLRPFYERMLRKRL